MCGEPDQALVLTGKNAQFAGRDVDVLVWERIATPIEITMVNGVEPYAYLKANWKAERIVEPFRSPGRPAKALSHAETGTADRVLRCSPLAGNVLEDVLCRNSRATAHASTRVAPMFLQPRGPERSHRPPPVPPRPLKVILLIGARVQCRSAR